MFLIMFLMNSIYYTIVFFSFYIILFFLFFLVLKNLYYSIRFFNKNSFVKSILKKSIKVHNSSSEALSSLLVIFDKINAQELVVENRNKVIQKQENTIEKQEGIILSQGNIIETQNREIQKIRNQFLSSKEEKVDDSNTNKKENNSTGLFSKANKITNNPK